MSEELQSAEAEVVETPDLTDLNETVEVQTQQGEESAASSEPEHESNTDDQSAIDDRIGKYAFEARQAQREKAELEQQLAALKQQNQPQEPSIREVKSEWDFDTPEEFESYNRAREAEIAAKAIWDNNKELEAKTLQAQEQNRLAEQQQKLIQSAQDYTKNAEKLGISQDELKKAGDIVAAYGLREDAVMGILSDPEGALITKALAANPSDIEALNKLSVWDQVNYINQTVRPKAKAFRPKETAATPPPTQIKGRVSDPEAGKLKHAAGGSFE